MMRHWPPARRFLRARIALWFACGLTTLLSPIARGAVPPVELRNGVLDEAGVCVPPNLLLVPSLGRAAACAAYPGITTDWTRAGADTKAAFDLLALSPAQRAKLDADPLMPSGSGAAADGLGEKRLRCLRGERSPEAGQSDRVCRARRSLLGEAIRAAPLYVGAPTRAYGGASYAAFQQHHRARRPVVYLSASDGLLHAFDAADRRELFAYIPAALPAKPGQFNGTHYAHRHYVNGAASAGEAQLAGQWKTVLLSGMGSGAQGVFALDITDPQHFARGADALWEFTDANDAMVGNILAAPLIGKFRIAISKGVKQYRSFAVFASGLNNYVDDGDARFVRSGAGALFLLALDKPVGQAWALGQNYYRLAVPISDGGGARALGPPALVAGSDGAVRYAYAGDLQGNLWRFDFTGEAPWRNNVGPGPEKAPLFVAQDAAGTRQPITQRPKVVYGANGGYLVLFGTGKWLEEADHLPMRFQQQSFYAIHDTLRRPAIPVVGRSALAARRLAPDAEPGARDPSDAHGAARRFRVGAADMLYSGKWPHRGWLLDFPDALSMGERSVSDAVLADGVVFFNSSIPGAEPCTKPGVRTYVLDSLTGFALDQQGTAKSNEVTGAFTPGFLRGPPSVSDMGRVISPHEPTGAVVNRKKYAVFTSGTVNGGTESGANLSIPATTLKVPAGRMSWREVSNWRELHDASR